jgi:hypothetical protein
MALNKNKIGQRNRADEMIKAMNSSTSDYVSELAALNTSNVGSAPASDPVGDIREIKPAEVSPASAEIVSASEPEKDDNQQVYAKAGLTADMPADIPAGAPAQTDEEKKVPVSEQNKEPEAVSETIAEYPGENEEDGNAAEDDSTPDDIDKAIAACVKQVKEEMPRKSRGVSKAPVARNGRRGARTKAERGEECRVQFSSTLTPDMLDRVRYEARVNYLPLSAFIEKVFTEYFERIDGTER